MTSLWASNLISFLTTCVMIDQWTGEWLLPPWSLNIHSPLLCVYRAKMWGIYWPCHSPLPIREIHWSWMNKHIYDASPTIQVPNKYAIHSPLQPHLPPMPIVEKNYNFKHATSREKGKLVLRIDVGHSNTSPVDLTSLTSKR